MATLPSSQPALGRTHRIHSSSSVSVTKFLEQAVFEEHILRQGNTSFHAQEGRGFVFKDVPLAWGSVAVRCIEASTTGSSKGLYAGSREMLSYNVRLMDQALPTVVTESGWAESMPRMQEDMEMVLTGLNHAVKIYIIEKWKNLSGGRVSGQVELYEHGCGGVPALDQVETIFPRPPATNDTQTLKIKRCYLFGGTLLPKRNGQDILHLPIEYLRQDAEQAIHDMGLIPA
ncbi:hypothetical protein PoHVEF18_003781 [Penicillium ochrochloron]